MRLWFTYFWPKTPRGRVLLFITLFAALNVFGAVGYHIFEGWSLSDSFYATLVSIVAFGGLGDLTPRTHGGKFFTIIIKALSLVIWGGILYSAMQTLIVRRVDEVTTQRLRSLNLDPLNIFICYRRKDSSGHAGRLYDRLVRNFGEEHVFMDVDTIKPSEDFVKVVEAALSSCDIFIAIIGRYWSEGFQAQAGLLGDSADYVRLEIVTALNLGIRIVPVLVTGAGMPIELPSDLAELKNRQALELSDLRWQRDVDQLLSVIEAAAVDKRASGVRSKTRLS